MTTLLDGGTRTFCTFRLGANLFGLDIRLIKEVNVLPPLTPVLHAPDAVRGYVNLRGQIHLVLDLKRLLGMEATELQPETRLMLFKPELGDPFGVLVDRIGDIEELKAGQIENPQPAEAELGAQQNELISGIGKLAGKLVILLDARKLLPSLERLRMRRSITTPGHMGNHTTETAS